MVHYCCIPNCHSMGETSPNSSNVLFFMFPNEKTKQFKSWMEQIRKAESLNKHRIVFWPGPEKPSINDSSNKEICSRHFTAKHFRIDENGQRLFVRDQSVPTIFPIIVSSNEIEWKDISDEEQYIVEKQRVADEKRFDIETVFIMAENDDDDPNLVEMPEFRDNNTVVIDSDDDEMGSSNPLHIPSNSKPKAKTASNLYAYSLNLPTSSSYATTTAKTPPKANNTSVLTSDITYSYPYSLLDSDSDSDTKVTAPIVHSTSDTITFESTTTSGKKIFITKLLKKPSTESKVRYSASSSAKAKQFYSFAEVMSAEIVPDSQDEKNAIKFCQQFLKQQTSTMANVKRIINETNSKIIATQERIKQLKKDLEKYKFRKI